MVKVHARRRGLGRGRGGFASLAHGGHNNLKGVNPLQSALPGKAHKHKQKHQHQHQHKPKSKTSDAKHTAGSSQFQSSSLGDDLDSILHANTLVKHIDPPFTELEDDFSRLKTQSIELATLVLHLQNSLEVEQQKHKKSHPPAPIPLARSISQDSANSGRIKTTTVKAPPIQTTQATQSSASDPFSIIYSTSPRRWSSRRTKVPSFPTPKTPGTAGSAGSPMSAQMVSPSSIQLTPTLDRLLDELHDAIQTRDGDRITRDLQIEPPLAQAYADLQMELQKHYPWGKDQHLRTLCERVLPKGPDGVRNAWESFAGHLLQYLQFIRDFAPQNLLKTNDDLKLLLNTSLICLGDTTFGVVILPSVIYLSRVLARIALGLDKRPDLVAQLLSEHAGEGHEAIREKGTFVEDAANAVREAFIKCLTDKSGPGGFGRTVAPQGKRIGIYKTANLCLKLLLQCRKLTSATTMFVSIDAQSPLLSYYPASQRVTYLYYLGRYLFANNHFYRAQLALQAAYDQCHAQAFGHRRIILVYLIASNICLGRFPSPKLLLRREAARLGNHFLPLCRLISSGDLSGFGAFLSLDTAHGQWFLQKRLLLQLRNRCEILVWRSLARRVFIEVGFPGGEDNKTPFLRLHLLQAAAQWLNRRASRPALQETATNAQKGPAPFSSGARVQPGIGDENSALDDFDWEFVGVEEAVAETGFDIESGTYRGSEVNGLDAIFPRQDVRPTVEEVESIMASLIQQDLLVGFLTHNNPRFAIPGAKTKGALAVGFPSVWGVVRSRKRGDEVPGWVKEDASPNVVGAAPFGSFGGGGRVVNLSGARPVGAGAA